MACGAFCCPRRCITVHPCLVFRIFIAKPVGTEAARSVGAFQRGFVVDCSVAPADGPNQPKKEGQPVFWLAWIVSVAYFSEVMRLLAKLAT